MYQVGESVCHCVHGLGVVQSVEEKQIQGKVARFSVVDFQGLTVMVNLERADGVLRPPITAAEAERVLEHLGSTRGAPDAPAPPAQILQGHLASLRSGDIYRVCDVVRKLSFLSRDKKLTPQQQELLKDARALLVRELAFVRKEAEDGLERRIDERLVLV